MYIIIKCKMFYLTFSHIFYFVIYIMRFFSYNIQSTFYVQKCLM